MYAPVGAGHKGLQRHIYHTPLLLLKGGRDINTDFLNYSGRLSSDSTSYAKNFYEKLPHSLTKHIKYIFITFEKTTGLPTSIYVYVLT